MRRQTFPARLELDMKLRNTSWIRISKAVLLPLAFLFFILGIWEIVCRSGLLDPWILPSPTSILNAAHLSFSLLLKHSWVTIQETLIGLLIAGILGVFTATVLEEWKLFRYMLYPHLVVIQTIPIISIAPLLIMWFGYGMNAKVFTVALVCFFPIAMNLLDGYRSVDANWIKLLRSMGANRSQIFWKIKLPAAMPSLFSGLKISATYSVMSAVIGEWLGASQGLGIYMTRASKSYQITTVFAIILAIVMISMSFFLLVLLLERLFIPWNFRHEEEYIE